MRAVYAATLLLFLSPHLAWGQNHLESAQIVRIEAIVFEPIGSRGDEWFEPELRSFADIPDVQAHARVSSHQANPAEDSETVSEADQAESEVSVEQAMELIRTLDLLERTGQAGRRSVDDGPIYPPRLVQLPTLSATMMRTWARLDDSGEFRPLTWRAWHQELHLQRVSPTLRIHDETLLHMDWLGREALLEPYSLIPVEPIYSRPRVDYRLDGTIRIRQRQFVHAEIDLAWRVPVAALPAPLADQEYRPDGYLAHRLTQSRTIEPGRLEYFDSDRLGVLILIEPLSESESNEPETAN